MQDRYTELNKLTSGKLLAKNTVWNLIGLGAPFLVAIFAIPLLVKGLGTDRFGLLTIAWVVIGYFSLFDFGVGRALTQNLAEKIGSGEDHNIPELIWTSLFILLLLGIAGSVLLSLFTPWLVTRVLNVPDGLVDEAINAFYILAISVPIITTSAGLKGVLEAKQKFIYLNMIRIPLGIFTLVGPLIVLPLSNSLVVIMMTLLVGRSIFGFAYFAYCSRVLPELTTKIKLDRTMIKSLLHFGSWMTASNLVSPVMTNFDRLFIGTFVSVSSVAYYATPHEVVTKLALIPGAIVGVLFPAFSTAYGHNQARTALLFKRGVNYTFLMLFPLALIIVAFAHEGLDIWLGGDFSKNGQHVMQWLTIGVFINSLAYIPFALIQGAGHPDITGKLQLIELPIYLLIFWVLIRAYGIEGAAVAWTIRVTIEAFILFVLAHRLLPNSKYPHNYLMIFAVLILILMMAMVSYMSIGSMIIFKCVVVAAIIFLFVYYSWHYILAEDEKVFVHGKIWTI